MIGRILARLFPSVRPADQAIVLAAMEGRDLEAPVSSSLGEDGVEAGQTPAAEAPCAPNPSQPGSAFLAAAGSPVVTQPVTGGDSSGVGTARPAPLSSDRPEGGDVDSSSGRGANAAVVAASRNASTPPFGPPPIETVVYWRPHPSRADEFTESWLAHLVERWADA